MSSMEKQDSHNKQIQGDFLRPQFHFSPPANWANDPNGLVYYQGEYHFFYQYYPDATVWGPMHWGHAVSADLVSWQHLPIALYPDEQGMMFSGSALVDWNNCAGFGREALIIFYTSHYSSGYNFFETQNLAYSTDKGRTWTKYSGNPVIHAPHGVRDIRDPKVIWYSEQAIEHWVMCLAVGDAIRFYTSSDLKNWQFGGAFGFNQGSLGGVWETPDLFRLQVDGGDESRWVLSVGVGSGGAGGPAGGSATQYFVGMFDGFNFISENSPETTLWADYGADYYAPQSWSDVLDGKRITIAWMNNWQYATLTPSSTFRGMFSLPRQLSLVTTRDGIRLVQKPLAEFSSLRTQHFHLQDQVLTPGINLLSGLKGDCLEILAEFELDLDADEGRFGFHLRAGDKEYTSVGYDTLTQTLFIDRTNSGQVLFHESFAAKHQVVIPPVDGLIRMHIFLDRTSLEVFVNDGQVVLTDTIFPSSQNHGLDIFTNSGKIKINVLDVFHLNPAGFGVI